MYEIQARGHHEPAYDCIAFHGECTLVIPINHGGALWLWCGDCRVAANLEAVSTRITVRSCVETREMQAEDTVEEEVAA